MRNAALLPFGGLLEKLAHAPSFSAGSSCLLTEHRGTIRLIVYPTAFLRLRFRTTRRRFLPVFFSVTCADFAVHFSLYF